MPLTKDVEEAIRANLPGQTAGVLKKYFEEHEELVRLHKVLKDDLEKEKGLTKHYQDEVYQLSSYRGRLEEIKRSEAELKERQIQFRIDAGIQEIREQHSLERVEDHKEMFNTVFRNTVLRENVMSSVPLKMGGYVSIGNNNESIPVESSEVLTDKTETKETSEE